MRQAFDRWQQNSSGAEVKTEAKKISLPEEDSPPVDLGWLQDVVGGDKELMQELSEIYLRQMSTDVGRLRAAVEANAPDEVRRIAAHSSTGGSATCGMVKIVAPLCELERMGLENRLAGAAPMVAQTEKELESIKMFLHESLMLRQEARK